MNEDRRWRTLSPLRDFLHTESAGGFLLIIAAATALVWANSPWSGGYDSLWGTELTIDLGGHGLALDLRHWVNDGLMAVFFLVVGLEIKREVTSGHLAGRRAAALPLAAAIGGMAVPAVVYLLIAGGTNARGWGVPMATDIALAVGVMALAGDRVPSALKAFLLGLAVVDDIGAIVVIAVFYSDGVSLAWLAAAAGALAVTVAMRALGVHRLWMYCVVGAVLWFALHEAGVHATLAGVAMGLLAPTTPRVSADLVDVEELVDLSSVDNARATVQLARGTVSTVEWIQHWLHPWTSFVIVPVFALANTGIVISADGLRDAWGSPIMWGVAAGLVVGKPLGVLLASRIALATGAADRPAGTNTRHLLGAGTAAGIGFTVALFIAELAFVRDGVPDLREINDAKLAILLASVLSGLVAFTLLRLGRAGGATSDAPQATDGSVETD
jgi:NhaA family Na+:H+ antiporter